MKASKTGLQKFTETDRKINRLLAKKKILKGEPSKLLNKKELDIFGNLLAKKLTESKGGELDKLLEKIGEIMTDDTKNQLWENNHYKITASMAKLIGDNDKMPTKNQIASDTGLSRQTIHKHLNGYAEHPLYAEQLKQFKFMVDRVLAKVIKAALYGDIKAARLYLDAMGILNNGQPSNNTLIRNQNNYIQINGTVISQEIIKQLSPEQLNTIESILKTTLPQPEPVKKQL